MTAYSVLRNSSIYAMGALAASAFCAGAAAQSQGKDAGAPRVGKYQMMQVMPKGAGGQASDTHEAWILDTETGRVIICGGGSGVCRSIDWKATAK
jgi:hypothetical protein